MPNYTFEYNKKLEIEIPIILEKEDKWTKKEKEDFLRKIQQISSKIPEKIKKLEERYMELYEKLEQNEEKYFSNLEELNQISYDISELNVLFLRIEGRFLFSERHF